MSTIQLGSGGYGFGAADTYPAYGTVTPPPTGPGITSFSPSSGPMGQTVTITGYNFTEVQSVRFNGKFASYTVNSATQITAVVPQGGGTTGLVTVITAQGTATSAGNFTTVYGPTDTQVLLNSTRVRTPVMQGIRSLSLWMKIDPARLPAPGTAGQGRFLFDMRQPNGQPLILMWTDDRTYEFNIQDVFIGGVRAPDARGLDAMATNEFVRVDIVFTQAMNGYATLFGRYDQDGGNYYVLGDAAATCSVLSTVITQEQAAANPSAAVPAGTVLARYTWRGINGDTLPDSSGNNQHATLLGNNIGLTGPAS